MCPEPNANSILPENVVDPFEGTNYRAITLLGSGGMGEVYVVEHKTLFHKYAAKILRAEFANDVRVVDRMRLEADALAKLDHPNIVQIHAFERTPAGVPFIVMELLVGATIRHCMLELGVVGSGTAIELTCELLAGLSAAHAIGIVHRDIKPSNLFAHQVPGGGVCLKMLDFGVARVLPGLSEDAPLPLSHPTRTGTAVGTPMFMSPEAAKGQKVDIRTDIYAAANILYLLLTGRGPFDDCGDIAKVLDAHATKPPTPPSQLTKAYIPPELDAAILKGLAKDPNDRFQTADEFEQNLRGTLNKYLKHPPTSTAKEEERVIPDVSGTQPINVIATEKPPYKRFAFSGLVLVLTIAIVAMGIRWVLR
jgi:serine/threonine-protein kinase